MTQQAQQLAPTKPVSPAVQAYDNVAKMLQREDVQAAIGRALPRHMSAERMIRVALTAIQKTPDLALCDNRSLIGAIVQASELGLEPNTPLQHAYLIPFWNKKTNRKEAQLMIGYRGMIALARRSDQISVIYAELVYEKDFFEIEYGLNKNLIHKPDLNLEDRGKMIGAYAVAKYKDGSTDFEYMSEIEIGKIRKRSQTPDKGPWVTDTGEMWRKTPIRRISKRLPQSIEDNTLQKAVEVDAFYGAGFDNIAPLELGEGPAPEVISEEQRVALVDAAKESGQDLAAIVAAAGFELIAHITDDRYDELYAIASTTPSNAEPSVDETPDVTYTDATVEEEKPPTVNIVDETEKEAPAPSEAENLLANALTVYRDLEGEQKLAAEAFLGSKAISELTKPKLVAFLKEFAG